MYEDVVIEHNNKTLLQAREREGLLASLDDMSPVIIKNDCVGRLCTREKLDETYTDWCRE